MTKTAPLKDPRGCSAGPDASVKPSRSVVGCGQVAPSLHEPGGEDVHELGPWTIVQRRKRAPLKGSSKAAPSLVATDVVQHGAGRSEVDVPIPEVATAVVQQDAGRHEADVIRPPVEVEQPIFGGFKAMAGDISGRTARLGADRRGASQRKDRQSSPLHSSCTTPEPSLSLVVHSAPLGTIVPYCQRLYEDVLPPHDHEEAELLLLEGSLDTVEGSLVEGQQSLKVERMLKDLGPISSLPRKRRLIAVDPDGGDASPSLPP